MGNTPGQLKVPKLPSVSPELVTHQLAYDLATGLYEPDDLVAKYEVSKAQFKRILKDSHFRRMYAEAKTLWNGSQNTQERIRQKSALLLEDSILPLYSIIHNATLAPAARIDAFAKLQSIADMQPTKGGDGAVKESFTLNIHMPNGNEQQFVIEGEVLETAEDE